MPGMSLRISLALYALLALSACTTLVRTPSNLPVVNQVQAEQGYANVLERFVNERGEVDFSALQRDRKDLDSYVTYVGAKRAEDFSDRWELLAHYINSYNALSMYNVLESGIPKSHAGLAKLQFFVLRKLLIGGEWRSLYGYENDVIRKLGEPRVHFALNCSALSCPVLPRSPFGAAELDQELTRETRKFFADSRNLRVDDTQRVIFLSEILRFFMEDFVPAAAPSLITYVNRYVDRAIPAYYQVKFLDYDWTIANAKRHSK